MQYAWKKPGTASDLAACKEVIPFLHNAATSPQ
jgi:hypothetical protein